MTPESPTATHAGEAPRKARSAKIADGATRPHVVAVRFSDVEKARLTELRGATTESEFLRSLVLPVLEGERSAPHPPGTRAVLALCRALTGLLLAWHDESLEVADAERIVADFLRQHHPQLAE